MSQSLLFPDDPDSGKPAPKAKRAPRLPPSIIAPSDSKPKTLRSAETRDPRLDPIAGDQVNVGVPWKVLKVSGCPILDLDRDVVTFEVVGMPGAKSVPARQWRRIARTGIVLAEGDDLFSRSA